MIKNSLLLLAFISFSLCSQFLEYEIKKAERTIQLNGAYIQQISKSQYHCLDQQCHSFIYYALRHQDLEKVAHIIFTKDKQTGQVLEHTTQEYFEQGKKFLLYKISIPRKIFNSDKFILVSSITYLNRYVNYPQKIDLTEDQKFQFEDNKRFLSPYNIEQCSVTYKFTKLLSYDTDGEKKTGGQITFKASNLQSFTYLSHKLHGVNNQPQVYFSEVVREIEVSHWGNIAITEFYKIKNIGPELKGQFSRVQYSSNNRFQAKNSWKGIQTNLPYQIWGLYYRDQVGNISTSRAFRDDSSGMVKVGFAPRFALLGGWKCNWEIGYNLKTEGFLTHDGNKFELNKVPIEYGLSQILAEKYTIKLILPQGTSNVHLSLGKKQLEMKNVEKGLNFGYLDFSGRPVYIIENLKGLYKDEKLKVSYDFQYSSIFKKPLLVLGAIFSILLVIIILKRVDMSAFDEHVKKTA